MKLLCFCELESNTSPAATITNGNKSYYPWPASAIAEMMHILRFFVTSFYRCPPSLWTTFIVKNTKLLQLIIANNAFVYKFFILVSKQHRKILLIKRKMFVFYKDGGFFMNEHMCKQGDDVKRNDRLHRLSPMQNRQNIGNVWQLQTFPMRLRCFVYTIGPGCT